MYKIKRLEPFSPDYSIDNTPHPDLDNVPKKTISQQVALYIEAGERLQEYRLGLLDLPSKGIDDLDADPDDYDSGIDRFSDSYDYYKSSEDLVRKVKNNKPKPVDNPKVESSKPPAPAPAGEVVNSLSTGAGAEGNNPAV